MTQHFFIGVDGGATKSVVRLEDSAGSVLGTTISGPANIRISVEQAWQSINSALDNIFQSLAIPIKTQSCQVHVGMGLAGCELIEAYQAFLDVPHYFKTLIVSSDAHTACLAAHGGKDGAIIITGTGVTGYQIEKDKIAKVGGWGFPHDDAGGGAWLGLQAISVTLQWLDGRMPPSRLAEMVYAFFGENQNRLVSWANQTNSTGFAELAPLVITASHENDPIAQKIMQAGAKAIDQIAYALKAAQHETEPLPCALMGGVATSIEPFLGEDLRARLCSSAATPDVGAILLIRNHLKKSGR